MLEDEKLEAAVSQAPASVDKEHLYKVALRMRYLLMAFLPLFVADHPMTVRFAQDIGLEILIAFVVLTAFVAVVICVVRVSLKLNTLPVTIFMGVISALLVIAPAANLILVGVLHWQSAKLLKKYGIPIGVFGAKPDDVLKRVIC